MNAHAISFRMLRTPWSRVARDYGYTLADLGEAIELDPRLRIYLSMLILEYPETLAPGRKRELFGLNALGGWAACSGRRTAL